MRIHGIYEERWDLPATLLSTTSPVGAGRRALGAFSGILSIPFGSAAIEI